MQRRSNSRSTSRSIRRRATLLALAAVGAWLSACAPPSALYGRRAAAADTLVRRAIAQESSINAANLPLNTVSVAPLRVITTDTAYASLGYGMAALLASDLARSARVTIVERLRVDAVLRELQLAQSGRVDTTTAPRIGRCRSSPATWATSRSIPRGRAAATKARPCWK